MALIAGLLLGFWAGALAAYWWLRGDDYESD